MKNDNTIVIPVSLGVELSDSYKEELINMDIHPEMLEEYMEELKHYKVNITEVIKSYHHIYFRIECEEFKSCMVVSYDRFTFALNVYSENCMNLYIILLQICNYEKDIVFKKDWIK